MTVEQLIERIWSVGEALAPWAVAVAITYGVCFVAFAFCVGYLIYKYTRGL